ncbi:hypothetical protein Q9966_013686 [Columba livia]|nr:hypothetical protein Q9966_013686 [Columba livia]
MMFILHFVGCGQLQQKRRLKASQKGLKGAVNVPEKSLAQFSGCGDSAALITSWSPRSFCCRGRLSPDHPCEMFVQGSHENASASFPLRVFLKAGMQHP